MSAIIICPAYSFINHRLMNAILGSRLPLLPIYETSDLPRTRSCLITTALQHGMERILFVDSDVVPTVDQLTELATASVVTPDKALTGMYAIRGEPGKLSVHAPRAPNRKQFKAEWSGLGFAAVHRESLLRLTAAMKPIQGDTMPWYPFCVPRIHEDGSYMADDRSFWWRLSTVGVSLVARHSLHVGHLCQQICY